MNILGNIQKWSSALYNLATNAIEESEEAKEGSESPSDSDGPGAGGGYEESDSVEIGPLDDGPGAGGGYFTESLSDGPGAGGGYDGDDVVEPKSDSDGPGAGGGYDDDSDGPGAGGGYDSFAPEGTVISATWNQDIDAYLADSITTTVSMSGDPSQEPGEVFTMSGEWTIADDVVEVSKQPKKEAAEEENSEAK